MNGERPPLIPANMTDLVTPFMLRLFGDWGSLSNRAGGLDSVLFLVLFVKLVFANRKSAFKICLRERDLSYFALDEWLDKVNVVLNVPYLRTGTDCILFGGEIPCLYLLSAGMVEPTSATVPAGPPAEFLALVDYVAKTTGSGVGILLQSSSTSLTQESTDLRSGVRVRYEVARIDTDNSKDLGTFYWVERAESGKGSSFRAPDAFARRGQTSGTT